MSEKQPPQPPPAPRDLPHFCYGMAYYLLPQLLFSDAPRAMGYFNDSERPAGAYLYALACTAQEVSPQREEAMQFQAHRAALTDSTTAYVLQYPTPPPFEMGRAGAVLAPFFSAILHNREADSVAYYTLGQRPLGGTTLRAVFPDGINANLGEGPPPGLDSFLEALRRRA